MELPVDRRVVEEFEHESDLGGVGQGLLRRDGAVETLFAAPEQRDRLAVVVVGDHDFSAVARRGERMRALALDQVVGGEPLGARERVAPFVAIGEDPARLAAERRSPQQLATLQAIVEEGHHLVDAGRLDELPELNNRFHVALQGAAGNAMLSDVLGRLGPVITWVYARRIAERHGYVGYADLPPGIRKNLARGKPLPPGIAKKMVPGPMLRELPAYSGYEWRVYGSDLVLVALATGVIADVLAGVFD